ncbi:3-deoxy-D-manno-octulosonate 8-phosphate phosphatase, partial [bacterium]|nr:3-deoxy-D-manno-octulosonate 8-phosphate phosphatase [bacterium]
MNIDKIKEKLKEKLGKIKILILDVDGVMTDGSIILGSKDGEEYKQFNVRDGTGIKMFQRAGLKVALITGRKSGVVERRAAELGIKDVYQGHIDKYLIFQEI